MNLELLKQSILSINKELRNTTEIDTNQKEGIIITNKITNLMDEAVYVLYEDETIKRCYSSKTLRIEIQNFINKFKEPSQKDFFDNLHSNLSHFISELKNRPKQQISYFIIISYLNTEVDLQIGNTKIIGHTSSELKRISDRFDSNLRAPNIKVNNHISSLFSDKVNASISLALYEIDGKEIEQIKNIALNEIKLVINIIRLFYFFEQHHTLSYAFNYFGISGFSFNKGQFIDYITSEEKSSIQIKNSFSIPFKIDTKFVSNIQTYQNILSNILRSNSKTELERLLITSIDFFGEGVNDFIYKYSFLSFFISLEVMLLRIKEDNITMKLSTRVAIVLGQDAQEKQLISKDIEKLYNIRSAIVHKGEDMVKYEDLLLLGNYTCNIILEILKINSLFENQDSLLNQIEKSNIYNDGKFIDTIQNQ